VRTILDNSVYLHAEQTFSLTYMYSIAHERPWMHGHEKHGRLIAARLSYTTLRAPYGDTATFVQGFRPITCNAETPLEAK